MTCCMGVSFATKTPNFCKIADRILLRLWVDLGMRLVIMMMVIVVVVVIMMMVIIMMV